MKKSCVVLYNGGEQPCNNQGFWNHNRIVLFPFLLAVLDMKRIFFSTFFVRLKINVVCNKSCIYAGGTNGKHYIFNLYNASVNVFIQIVQYIRKMRTIHVLVKEELQLVAHYASYTTVEASLEHTLHSQSPKSHHRNSKQDGDVEQSCYVIVISYSYIDECV